MMIPSALPPSSRLPSPGRAAAIVGVAQIFAWGGSYFLLGALATPIAEATGWPAAWVAGGLSLAMLVSGLVSPPVGRLIARFGGRRVLSGSALLMAGALVVVAAAPGLPMYLAGWALLGVAMGGGLFDPAFAAFGRLYGEGARPAITQMTLWAGVSSSICWPITATLAETVGWRGTCLAYAAVALGVIWPLYHFGLPVEEVRPAAAPARAGKASPDVMQRGAVRGRRLALGVYCTTMTLSLVQVTVMSVELIPLFQSYGLPLATAVGLAAIFGPSQVGGRVVEMALGRRRHPVWTLILASAGSAVGLAMLPGAPWVITIGMVVYGAACGIRSIARGTVPLTLVGQADYAAAMGRLALPMLVAQAVAPNLGTWLMDALGGPGLLGTMVVLTLVNLALSVWLLVLAKRRA